MDLLHGLTVLDFTRYYPGPFATLRLQDWGARVIKIESIEGDPGRELLSYEGAEGSVFRSVNRGKESLFIDLKNPEEKMLVDELITECDILIEGFRPGVAKRLGLGFEDAQQMNSDIVYCSLSGYGQNGLLMNHSGHDLNYVAISGLLDQFVDSKGKPIKPNIALADLIGGMAASEAMLAGLAYRNQTGMACYLDVSIVEATLSFLGLHSVHASLNGGSREVIDNSISYNIYETADKRYVTIAAMEDKFWDNFCTAVQRPDLLYRKNSPACDDNEYYLEMKKIFKSEDFEYWMKFFEEADCCFAPVLAVSEATSLEHFINRGVVREKWNNTYISNHYAANKDFLNHDSPFPEKGIIAN